MDQARLTEILAAHGKWLRDEGGERADLREADLRRDTLDAAIAAVRELRAPLTDKALRGVLLQGIDAIEALKEEP
jgi:hypothetical protein